jgi:predicted ATP-grasp superfamily ATP-dependent carboligase
MKANAPLAIVTDALWRKSVSAIRALGSAGYEVYATGDSWLTTGFYSRYTSRYFVGATAAQDHDGFGHCLHRAVDAAHGRPVAILPMEDASCEWLLKHGGELPGNARWLLPTPEAFAIARDKGRTCAMARQLGIPCPATCAPSSVEELRELVESKSVEDFVLKPCTGSGSSGIVYGKEIKQVVLERHWATHGPLLLQERIPGDGVARGVSLFCDRAGKERASFEHERVRQYPLTGGPSTQRKSVPLDALHDYSSSLLAAIGWCGVAMVEWKIHPETGQPKLLEINPRFWGSLALAVRSGVDFPTLYADEVLGRPLPSSQPSYRTDVNCRWLMPGDVLRYISESREERESLRAFIRGSWQTAEEIDPCDARGSVACFLCPALLAANPRYWKYLRRGGRRVS